MTAVSATSRCVTGINAAAGTAAIELTPGTTSNGMPASASASASSPPRPNTNGSPPFSRTTSRPRGRASRAARRPPPARARPGDEQRVGGASATSSSATSASWTSASQRRSRSSPRAVISPGSPGPAPTRCTVTTVPPRRAPGSGPGGPRRSGSASSPRGAASRSCRASSACSGLITARSRHAGAGRARAMRHRSRLRRRSDRAGGRREG